MSEITNKDRAERARRIYERSDYNDPGEDEEAGVKDLITDLCHLLTEIKDGNEQIAIEIAESAIRMFEIEFSEDD